MTNAKTYKMSAWRYHEGAQWSTTEKGKRVTFTLGKVLKRTARPGNHDMLVVERERNRGASAPFTFFIVPC